MDTEGREKRARKLEFLKEVQVGQLKISALSLSGTLAHFVYHARHELTGKNFQQMFSSSGTEASLA